MTMTRDQITQFTGYNHFDVMLAIDILHLCYTFKRVHKTCVSMSTIISLIASKKENHKLDDIRRSIQFLSIHDFIYLSKPGLNITEHAYNMVDKIVREKGNL